MNSELVAGGGKLVNPRRASEKDHDHLLRELNRTTPTTKNIKLVLATLKLLNKRTSTMGSFWNHSQITSETRPTAATTINIVMKCDPNQSSSCPLSSATWRAPTPTASRAKPM